VGFDNEDEGEGSQEANVTAGRIKSVSVEGCVLPEGWPSGTNKAACHQRWDYVRMPVYRAFSHRDDRVSIFQELELYPCSAQWGCSQVSRALYILYRSTVQSLVWA